MKNSLDFIRSGILEHYILGLASDEEKAEVEEMSAMHTDVRESLDKFSIEFEEFLSNNSKPPPVLVKPLLMASVDFMGRMQHGEAPGFPPEMKEGVKISDYDEWLNRPDMVTSPDFKDFFAKIIGYTPQMITAIVWIKDMAPDEVHNDLHEKFLVVEGTCTITIGEEVHNLVPGDYLAIHLHRSHFVTVTSDIPCKVIQQRVAA